MNKITNFFRTFIRYLWSLFLNGLLTILPITLTLSIFNVSFRLLKGWLEPIAQVCPKYLLCLPHAEIFIAVVIIFLIGTILKLFMLRSLVHAFESLLLRVPIIRTVYSGIQQLVKAFNPQDQITFKQVVFLEFPRTGIYSIGFLTSEMPLALAPEKDKEFVNVFVPTTPMPTSGFFIIVTRDKLMPTDLSHQEAIALIISGGIIKPDRFMK
ncbi:MAG: DUF502 domain-containing protein [Candidatus Dependentiae bacterium]